MEDKLKKIYALYIQKGLLTAEGTTFEKWSQADEAQQIKLFELGQRKGLFGKETSAESFTSLWSLKKKDESQPIGQEGVMESDTQVVQEEPISSEFSGVEAEFETPEFVTEEEVIGQVPNEFGGGDVVQYEAGRRRRGQAGVISKGEKDTWLERTVGKNEVTDFFGDLWRAGAKGYETGNTIDEALELSFKGRSASDQDIADFIRVNDSLNQTGPSDEMKAFNKAYSAAGGGAWGFIKGIIAAPTSVNEIAVTSVAQMVNPAVAAGAGTGAVAGGLAGSTGFSAGPLGVFTTAGGAIAGALGGAGATLEAGLSFSEFLQEELAEKGLAFDQEGVRKVLEDEEAMFRIRTRSAGRGAAIGIIDGFTAGFASKIAKGVGQTAIKAGKTAKRANLAATAAATGIEGLGGGVGEAAARALVGQEMDAAEIGFEIVGGAPGSAITMLRNTAGRGKYTMGPDEAPVTFEEMVKIIEETDDATFAGMKLRIKGDEVLKGMAEDRKDALKQKQAKVEQLGEDLDNLSVEDAEAAIELETELDKVSGGLTRAKKNRKKEIESQLDEIYSRRQEPAVEAVVEVTTEEAVADLKQENNIRERNGMEVILESEENIEKQRQQLLKEKQDAIQESSTTEVDVQEQTEDGQPMGDGDSEGGVTVEGEGETEGTTEATQEEIEQGAQDLGDLLSGLTESPGNLGDGTRGRNVTEDTEETSVEVVSGIDAEGNPVMAPPQPGVEVSENLTVVDQTETDSHYGSENFRRESPNETPQQHEEMLMGRVDKALKAVKRLFPKLKIVMHRSEASYKDNVSTNSRGAFNPNTNTIHINMPKATGRTIGHEVFHAILKDRFGSEVNIQTATKALIKSLRAGINKSTNLTPEQVLELERYAQIFDGDKAIVQDEEFLAEFVGFLSETYSKLEVPQQTAIKQWLAKIAQVFGFSPQEVLAQTDRDVVDLLNTIAEKVTEGQEITETDVAVLGTEEIEGGQKVSNPADALKTQIIGQNAELSQNVRDNLGVAREMTDAKKSIKDIRLATGWELGGDGKWRYEIPDGKIKEGLIIDELPKTMGGWYYTNLSNVLKSPELFKMYDTKQRKELPMYNEEGGVIDGGVRVFTSPPLKDVTVYFKSGMPGGAFDPTFNTITVSGKIGMLKNFSKTDGYVPPNASALATQNLVTEEVYLTLLHEVQHYIQQREGFAIGETDIDSYKVTAGEVEARNVEVRSGMTTVERAENTLESTEDVAREDQIFFFDPDKVGVEGKLSKRDQNAPIKTQAVTEVEGGQKVSKPSSALKTQAIGAFEVSYTQQEKVAQMIKEGLITEPDDISFLKGKDTIITSPDDMLVGEISLNGKPIFEGGGGVFFVTKYGEVWAAGKKATAEQIARGINRGVKDNGGKGYLTLTKGADKKLVSSASGVNSTLAILDSMLDEGLVSSSNFRVAVSSAVKKAGGEIDLRGSSKKLKADVNEYFSDPSTTTFEKRGSVVEVIVGEIAKSLPKELRPKVVQFLGGNPNKSVGATKTPKSHSLVDLVAGVAAEKLTKGLKTGDVYAVIEVDGEVEVVKGDHKSYPWHVKLKDGSKPILHLPKNREAGGKALVQKSGKPYAVRNVSVVEGKFQGQTEGIKTQAIVENTTEEVSRLKGLEKKSEDGATLNIDGTQYTGGGLVVPAATKNTTQSELTPQMIEKFVKDNEGKIGTDGIVKVGLYKFPKSDQVSIDLNIVVPAKNEKAALEFGRLAGQESLFSLDTFENIKTGATGANPISFTDAQFRQIAKDLKANKVPKVFDGDIKTQIFNKNMTVEDIIKFGRENNFSDAEIKDYLVRIRKENIKDVIDKKTKEVLEKGVDTLMAIDTDMFRKMPVSFGNVKGGAKVGAKLFARAEKFMNNLNEKNKRRRLKNRISEREVMDQTIEFLEKQPEYIAEGGKRKAETDQQTQMIIDMQKALGVNPTKGMNTRIREMRQKMVERRRGGMDLQAVKRDLRNFIRQALPTVKGSTYSKSELMTLLGKVAKADKKNIANLMDEVVDIVTKRQVKALDAKIESILNGKYEVVQSGRLKGVKIDNETRERLERIKDAVTDEAMTEEDIVAADLTLNEEFTKLNEKPDQTEQDLNRMADLMVIMSLNNSKLMDDTSIDKVESLNTAEDILLQIVGEGKETFKEQLRADHERYQDQFVKVYKDVTGETIDLSDPEVKDESKKAARKQARAQKARDAEKGLVKYLRKLNRKIKSFLKSSESIEGLMHIIAEAPGAIFGGNARKLVYEKLSAAERVYKARMMEASTFIQSKVKEVYGKDWKEISRGNSVRTQTGVYVDPAAVKKAQEKYDGNKTFGNKKALEEVKRDEMVSLSPNEIGYLWQQYQDPANLPSFANEENVNFGPDHARIMSELVETIGGEDGKIIELAKWQVEEAYPSMYAHINEAYKKIYRTNMPWNKFYAGMLKREGRETQPLDMLASKEAFNNQVGGASTKMRIKNSRPIEPRDMMGALVTYTTDMEWFAAMGPTIRDINKLFGNPMMRKAIINVTGESTMRLIDHHIKNIAARGVNTERGQDFVNAMNNMFATTRLGFSPNIAIKQLTSIPTYATDIGWGNYVFHAVKNKAEFIKVLNEIRKNSVYMQDRLSSDIRKVTESYSANQDVEFVPKSASSYFVNMMMGFIKAGDITAIYLGGMPNYSFYKSEFMKANPNATEQEAIDHAIVKFELDTKSTQQSMDLTDKDFYQSSGAFARALNLFKTSQKQYLRKEFAGMRNLRRGFRDKNFKQIMDGGNKVLMYHFMMPMLFQYIASGLPGLMTGWDDEDKEDMIRAAVLGNFNALFAVGDIIKGTADAVQGKPWADKVGSIPIFEVFADINKNYMKWQETKNPEKKQEAFEKMMARIGEVVTLGKIPFANINRMYKNIEKAGDAKTGEEVTLRLLNYSDYVIEGPKKSKAKEEGEKKFTPAPSRDARGKKSRSRDRR